MLYDSTRLRPHDPTSLEWAVAWTRFLLRDTSTTPLFNDTELVALLDATAFVVAGVPYYRPQVTTAHLIAGDPDRALSESLLGVNITTRDPTSVARSIRALHRWIDDEIEALTRQRPPTGRQLRATY